MVLTRRQSAIAASNAKDGEAAEANINPAYVDVEDEFESDGENNGKESTKSKAKGQPASKRAKNNADSSETKTTRITRKKKSIGLLLTMPLDVIFLVFLGLSLKDLIALTRTSKPLRETLKAHNAMFIWKTIREENQVPDPPHDFSEQRWAALLFGGPLCQCCGTSSVHTVDFLLRRRLCTKCKKNNYVVKSKFPGLFPDHDTAVLELIPYTDVGGWSHGHASSSKFYWKPDIVSIIRQWSDLKSKRGSAAQRMFKDFCKEREDHVDQVIEEAELYTEWSKRIASGRVEEIQVQKKVRVGAIVQKFVELGYEMKDIDYIRYEKSVDSPNELTDRAWNRIRPVLEQVIIQQRAGRRLRERELRISRRKEAFRKVFHDHKKALLPREWFHYPRWWEVSEFPVFKELLDAPDSVTVDENSLTPFIAQVPDLVAKWLDGRKAILKEELEAAIETSNVSCSSIESSSPDICTLAIFVFKCGSTGCRNDISLWTGISGAPLFGWSEAADHSCEAIETHHWHLPSLLNSTVTLFKEGLASVIELVLLVGLDPSHATVEDMDRGGHYFFCSDDIGASRRTVYTWRIAVAHAASQVHRSVTTWRLLTSAEVRHVVSPVFDAGLYKCWGCNHCSIYTDEWKSKKTVVDHLKSLHNIPYPQVPADICYYHQAHRKQKVPPYWDNPNSPKENLSKNTKQNARCKHCDGNAGNRLFIVGGVNDHLKMKHGINDPRPMYDFVYA